MREEEMALERGCGGLARKPSGWEWVWEVRFGPARTQEAIQLTSPFMRELDSREQRIPAVVPV